MATTPRLSVASRSGTVDAKNNISPAKTQQTSPTSHSRWDRRSGGSKAQSMKKAAKPSGAFPRTSVEKNCRNASPAMTSMGLDAEAGETRMLVDSPGTLVADSMLVGTRLPRGGKRCFFTGSPAVLCSSCVVTTRVAVRLPGPLRDECSAAALPASGSLCMQARARHRAAAPVWGRDKILGGGRNLRRDLYQPN